MAGNHLRRKTQTYQSLYHVNHCFNSIVSHCWRLEQAGFVPANKMQVFRGLVRELQSYISHDVADSMHHVEDADLFHFGKVRIAWEHHLNPARPPFNSQK